MRKLILLSMIIPCFFKVYAQDYIETPNNSHVFDIYTKSEHTEESYNSAYYTDTSAINRGNLNAVILEPPDNTYNCH